MRLGLAGWRGGTANAIAAGAWPVQQRQRTAAAPAVLLPIICHCLLPTLPPGRVLSSNHLSGTLPAGLVDQMPALSTLRVRAC